MNYLSKIMRKGGSSEFDLTLENAVDFDHVINNDKENPYSLKQFFDNYLSFMKNSFFMAKGGSSNGPGDQRFLLWIDTNAQPYED